MNSAPTYPPKKRMSCACTAVILTRFSVSARWALSCASCACRWVYCLFLAAVLALTATADAADWEVDEEVEVEGWRFEVEEEEEGFEADICGRRVVGGKAVSEVGVGKAIELWGRDIVVLRWVKDGSGVRSEWSWPSATRATAVRGDCVALKGRC